MDKDSTVKPSLDDERLDIPRTEGEPPTLEGLLRGVTDKNIHGEWDTGPIVGNEAM